MLKMHHQSRGLQIGMYSTVICNIFPNSMHKNTRNQTSKNTASKPVPPALSLEVKGRNQRDPSFCTHCWEMLQVTKGWGTLWGTDWGSMGKTSANATSAFLSLKKKPGTSCLRWLASCFPRVSKQVTFLKGKGLSASRNSAAAEKCSFWTSYDADVTFLLCKAVAPDSYRIWN